MKKVNIPAKIIFPVICVIVGIILCGYIIYDYDAECERTKWPSVDAVVIDLNSYEESGGSRRIGNTVYVITYSYDINGVEYKGETSSYTPILVGDSFEVKYNPELLSVSTAVTAPDTQRFIIVLLFGIVLIVSGAFFTIIVWENRILLTYKTEDKPCYHEQSKKRNSRVYFILLPIGVFLIGVVLMYYQPFMQKNINADEFVQIMEGQGYETENSIDRLQAEFGMGSLIEQSYSVNTENLRIDFCQLNTSKNADKLYDYTSLNAKRYVISKGNFVAAQNDEFFFLKAVKNNTFVYGACKIEEKEELLRLIEYIDYYNEQQ